VPGRGYNRNACTFRGRPSGAGREVSVPSGGVKRRAAVCVLIEKFTAVTTELLTTPASDSEFFRQRSLFHGH